MTNNYTVVPFRPLCLHAELVYGDPSLSLVGLSLDAVFSSLINKSCYYFFVP